MSEPAQGVYLTGCEPASGKSAVALGLQQLLARRVRRLGVFRPARGATVRDIVNTVAITAIQAQP